MKIYPQIYKPIFVLILFQIQTKQLPRSWFFCPWNHNCLNPMKSSLLGLYQTNMLSYKCINMSIFWGPQRTGNILRVLNRRTDGCLTHVRNSWTLNPETLLPVIAISDFSRLKIMKSMTGCIKVFKCWGRYCFTDNCLKTIIPLFDLGTAYCMTLFHLFLYVLLCSVICSTHI